MDDPRDPGPDLAPAREGATSLGERLAELAESLVHGDDLVQALDAVVHAAAGSVPGAEHASVTETTGRVLQTRSASSDFATTIDGLQYRAGEGPCLEALVEHPQVLVQDLRTDPRWPSFSAGATEAGLRSAMSLRLFSTGERTGALNLFSTRPHAFDDESQQMGALIARHAALALAATHEVEQLQQAVATRDVIGQAKGMLMERHGLDADKAFAVLVRYSRDTNTRLRDVAEALVRTRSLPGPG